MKDQFKTLSIFLCLASIIIVLNNCKEATFSRNNETNNIVDSEDSIFQSSTPEEEASLRENGDEESGNTGLIKRTSTKVDPEIFLQSMSFFFGLAEKTVTQDELVEFLIENETEPKLTTTYPDGLENKVTIETGKPFNGMQYTRATFLTGEDGTPFFKRISFNLPKSDTAFSDTVIMLEENFNGLSEQITVEGVDNLVRYLAGDYIMSIRMLTENDLNHPYNAYTQNDIGKISVTLEHNFHGSDFGLGDSDDPGHNH